MICLFLNWIDKMLYIPDFSAWIKHSVTNSFWFIPNFHLLSTSLSWPVLTNQSCGQACLLSCLTVELRVCCGCFTGIQIVILKMDWKAIILIIFWTSVCKGQGLTSDTCPSSGLKTIEVEYNTNIKLIIKLNCSLVVVSRSCFTFKIGDLISSSSNGISFLDHDTPSSGPTPIVSSKVEVQQAMKLEIDPTSSLFFCVNKKMPCGGRAKCRKNKRWVFGLCTFWVYFRLLYTR